MRLVIALGGNALLRRGEPPTAANQRANVRLACRALAPLAADNDLVVSHGNGPQVGLLALQAAAYRDVEAYPLDLLGAESEGMIGYLIEQELAGLLTAGRPLATLLTQIEVDPSDPAFHNPSKPIGPQYGRAEAQRLAAERGWAVAPDGEFYRRVVASPRPQRILELGVIELLLGHRAVVICAGGGGIPVVARADGGLSGVEAVIDKDRASALLATELAADALLLLTDVDAVWAGWGEPGARAIGRAAPTALRALRFAPGSMGPKVEAACAFAEATGRPAGIGALADAASLLTAKAGTLIDPGTRGLVYREAA